ncbi:MAG TPA: CBS domain-containing protein [Proteobacteria bacterium]|nr:CBS domain-containing protein [Pseudomonadota bacterium]
MATTVATLLERKSPAVFSVSPETSIFEAGKIMADKGIGVILVLEGKRVMGMVSERDIVQKVIIEEQCEKDCPVSEIMNRQVIHVSLEDTIETCMAIMTAKRYRHLTVMEAGELVGIISIGDLIKCIIDEKEMAIKQYKKYIYEDW